MKLKNIPFGIGEMSAILTMLITGFVLWAIINVCPVKSRVPVDSIRTVGTPIWLAACMFLLVIAIYFHKPKSQ